MVRAVHSFHCYTKPGHALILIKRTLTLFTQNIYAILLGLRFEKTTNREEIEREKKRKTEPQTHSNRKH